MTSFTDPASVPSISPEPFDDRLRLAVAAYLARVKGSSREHSESDLRCYLSWSAERGLDPLAAKRPHPELYIRADAGSPAVKALHRLLQVLCYGRVLPDLRPGRHPRALACRARPPSVSAPPNHRLSESPTCSSRLCSLPPGNHQTAMTSRSWSCSDYWSCGSSKPPARTSPTSRGARPPGVARVRQGHQDRACPAAACCRPGH